jgi:Ran GTPase-activating protein (RanGAP) involved in mRNA processing and transport
MPEVDAAVKEYFKKYSFEAEPSEHFPLMELPAYDCEEKLASAEVFYQSEKGYDDNDAIQLGKAIAAMQPQTLKQIYLTKNAIGDAGAIGLAAGLKELEAMDTIHVAENNIGGAGMAALSESIKHLGCTTLVFTRNPIGDDGAAAFAKALADPENFKNLEWLFLNECEIGDRGAAEIAKALLTGCKELVRIALHDNKIGDEGTAALADAFNMGAIAQTGEFFYFQNNPFTEEGKQKIAKACRGKIRVHLGWPPPLGMLEPEDWDR